MDSPRCAACVVGSRGGAKSRVYLGGGQRSETRGIGGIGGDIVAVPPAAFKINNVTRIYTLDMSLGLFKAAPQLEASTWDENDHTVQVAAAYRSFGFEPYFNLNSAVERAS